MSTKIVIADDDSIAIKLLSAILNSDDGLSIVDVIGNGKDAITSCEEHKPDIICLDINMPGMTGTEAISEIITVSPGTRIIMISGCATMNLVNSSLDLGAEDFIIKPFDYEKVMAIILKK
jgi:YesN/AraC family two-component response regulator